MAVPAQRAQRACASERASPVTVLDHVEEGDPYLSDIVAVALGGVHSCALIHDGRVACWGDDSLGQLGLSVDNKFYFGRATRVARFGRGTR